MSAFRNGMTTPRLSIIIPIRNAASDLAYCLNALGSSPFKDYEVIVVDDGSTKVPAALVESHARVRLVAQPPRGPAAARNRGAEVADGEILVFFDADTMPHHDVLERVVRRFDEFPRTDAVFGSYDASPTAPHLVSQFRNLHHHFIHQSGPENASTFWAGCGAIRRDVFQAAGGFDTSYVRPCIEDVELGCRLVNQGHSIWLDRAMLVTHRKRWTMLTTIATDVRDRAAPWTRLILRERSISDVGNLHWSQQVSALLTWMAVLLLAIHGLVSPWAVGLACLVLPSIALLDGLTQSPRGRKIVELLTTCAVASVPGLLASRAPLSAVVLVAVVGSIIWLNRRFYRFLVTCRGYLFASACLPLHLLYYLYASLTFAFELCRFQPFGSRLRRRFQQQGSQPCL